MAVYSGSITAFNASVSNQPICDLLIPPNNNISITEVAVHQFLGTGSVNIGLGRTNASVQLGKIQLNAEDPSALPQQSFSTLAAAWTIAPIAPVQFLRRTFTPGSIASGAIWTFPRGLDIPANSSITLWFLGAGTNSPVLSNWTIYE